MNPWDALQRRAHKLPLPAQSQLLSTALAYLEVIHTGETKQREGAIAALDQLTRKIEEAEEAAPKSMSKAARKRLDAQVKQLYAVKKERAA